MEIKVDQIEKRSWVEVNLQQIEDNLEIYRKHLKKKAEIMAVVKADAYGHGDAMVAKALEAHGVHLFAVSNIDEAVGLRNAGIDGEILILGYSSPKYANTIYYLNLTQAIVSDEYAKALALTGYHIKCQFAIDTGMNRIGLPSKNAKAVADIVRSYDGPFQVTGIFTHLCVADGTSEEDHAYTQRQLELFKLVADELTDMNLPYIHCYNSAGGLYYLKDDDFNKNIGNIVRLGIVLYGLKPDRSNVLPKGIKPAMNWMSAISLVKDLEAGKYIGYGRTFVTKRKSKIATVTTGYADGFRRQFSNTGFIMINGQKAPIVGNVCMDQTLVDVTDIPDVKMGDKVTLMGKNKGIEYDADAMAADLGTIGYEIICDISKRVQRFYV